MGRAGLLGGCGGRAVLAWGGPGGLGVPVRVAPEVSLWMSSAQLSRHSIYGKQRRHLPRYVLCVLKGVGFWTMGVCLV